MIRFDMPKSIAMFIALDTKNFPPNIKPANPIKI
jgi:hypothetical protein